MPPKKAKLHDSEMFDDEADEEKTAGGRKRAPAKPRSKHAAIVLAIDVGITSSSRSMPTEDETDLQRSLQIVEWLISRKLFTESTDHFSLLFFGHESTTEDTFPNVYVHNGEMEKARVEWLQLLKNEVQANPKCPGDYLMGLYAALETMKLHAENPEVQLTEATIILLSNFGGLDEGNQVMEAVDKVANAFKILGASLIVIGPDLTEEPKSKAQKIGYNFIRQLAPKIEATSFNFQEGLSKLKFFIPKPVSPRGQPFNLELGKDFSIRVQMYLKNVETPFKLSFNPVSTSDKANGQQLKKVRRYETVADEGQAISLGEIDQAPDTAFGGSQPTAIPTGKFVEKGDIIKGYRYGKTLVTFDRDEQKLADIPREGKQLQLIQFTQRENILPQFLLGNPRYILPHKDAKGYDQAAYNTLSALVQGMIENKVVALCRYAYNIISNPRLVCLIPKMTKEEKYPILIHYVMPFRDDFRYFDFPPILSSRNADFQQEAYMDDYINFMMLSSEDGSNELLRKVNVHDPRIQYQCMTLREKALNPGKSVELSAEDKRGLLELLSPPKGLIEKAKEVIEGAKEIFPLELNEKTRMAAFSKPKVPATLVCVDDALQPVLLSLEENKLMDDEKGGEKEMDMKKGMKAE